MNLRLFISWKKINLFSESFSRNEREREKLKRVIANWGDKCQFNRQYWPVLTPSIIWFVIWRWLKFAFEEFTLQPPPWDWLHWEAVKWCARVMLDKCAGEWSVLIHTPSSKQTKVQNIRLVILFWPFCRPTAANPLHELSVFSKVFLSAEQLTAIYLIFIEFRWLHCTDNRLHHRGWYYHVGIIKPI